GSSASAVAVSPEELKRLQFKNLSKILSGKDVRLKLGALYLIGHTAEERYMPLLTRQLEAKDKRVRDMAGKAFDQILEKMV
ncbi:MAG: hypothetical protein AAF840_12170, partial [Bacteroidota bacterium]